jgi:hypothetical protein
VKEGLEQMLSSVVTSNGELNANLVARRSPLYTGRNGKVIERFEVEFDGRIESYIFKPLTNGSTCGRERWVYEHLLASVPVRVPKLYATAEHEDPDRFWAIYEDMGELSHHLEASDYEIAAACIPLWHSLPLARVPALFKGDKQELIDLLDEVYEEYGCDARGRVRLLSLGLKEDQVAAIEKMLRQLNGCYKTEIVISHGDYHQGNLARREDEIIILDWEFVHHNSVYWDLYCLLDMSHPDFPKRVSPSTRLAALQAYRNKRLSLGWETGSMSFITDYHCYAIIHSLWMLGLIEKDLQKGQWDMSKLRRAQEETIHSLVDCLAYDQ